MPSRWSGPISRKPGDEDVFRKVRADFDAKKVAQSDHQIRRTMDELHGDGRRADLQSRGTKHRPDSP